MKQIPKQPEPNTTEIHEGGGWDLNGDHDGCLMLAWIAGVMAIGIVLALMFAAMT